MDILEMNNTEFAALVYLIAVNLIAFCLFGIDKRRAIKDASRIPERRLHFMGIIGGFVGGYAGMTFFRHKTQKTSFKIAFFFASLFSAALLFFLVRQYYFT